MMNLAEAKEKFYPEYKYALVSVKSQMTHSLFKDRKSAEEERNHLMFYYLQLTTIVDLSEVKE